MITYLVLLTLATYRLSRMIAAEGGPFDMFLLWRTWAHNRGGWVAEGSQCIFCISFWLSWPMGMLAPWEAWQDYVLLSLGTAGGVVVVKRALDLLGGG